MGAFGILGLSGFRHQEEYQKLQNRVVDQKEKSQLQTFKQEIESVIMENYEQENREKSLSKVIAVVWNVRAMKIPTQENQGFLIQNTSRTKVVSIENSMNEIRLVVTEKYSLYLVMNQN